MAHLHVLNVGVFDSDPVAVGRAQRDQDVAQLHLAAAKVRADVEGGLQIGLAEPELLK